MSKIEEVRTAMMAALKAGDKPRKDALSLLLYALKSKQIDKRLAAYQRELIETHYQEVENMYRQVRGWRHDYRNHIQMMKVLAANGDLEGLKAYLDQWTRI